MIAISLWAHRQRLSVGQTHQPPAAAVGCCRGTAASSPQSTRRGQSPSAPLRRTRPTLLNKTQRAGQPTLSGILPPPAVSPFGQGASRPAGRLHSQTGAPPSHPGAGSRPTPLPNLTHSKTRPTQTLARRNTSTLRRSGSSGNWSGRHTNPSCAAPSPGGIHAVPFFARCSPLVASPPTPEALRPPLLLSNR